MRVIQGKTAESCECMNPEEISEKKIFVKIAVAHMEYTCALIVFYLTRMANPGVLLKEPDWNKLKSARIPLQDILREKRKSSLRSEIIGNPLSTYPTLKNIGKINLVAMTLKVD